VPHDAEQEEVVVVVLLQLAQYSEGGKRGFVRGKGCVCAGVDP
jgi:hypothetical protein